MDWTLTIWAGYVAGIGGLVSGFCALLEYAAERYRARSELNPMVRRHGESLAGWHARRSMH